ncbi:bacteriophage abortive infection AbiH family protein [Roseivirga pacifica]|uniref:bacteriophage abortive infection AbiH family protein n=1 Tax=Roseivirga pacifica TaxID=1267423 RepID=UPI003BAC6AE3
MSQATLYIIGNGFDLYHRLKTGYHHFGLYLQANNPEIFGLFESYFGFPAFEEGEWPEEWNYFERGLANLEFEEVLEAYSDYIGDPGAPDFRDRDWHTYDYILSDLVENLTTRLLESFKAFLQAVEFPILNSDLALKLDKKSLFFNFNYTDTLERYYGLDPYQIKYIHGKALSDDKLVLGHGIDPKQFVEEDQKPPEGLTEEELGQWYDQMNDNYNYSYESGKSSLKSYYEKSQKKTADIIKENKEYWASLKGIQRVIVLGHSLSDVDLPYFQVIIGAIDSESTEWVVSYHSDSDKEKHLNTLINLGIMKEQIKLMKMTQLV